MSCNGKPPTSPPEIYRLDTVLPGRTAGLEWIVPPPDTRDHPLLVAIDGQDPWVARQAGCTALAVPMSAVTTELTEAARASDLGLLSHAFPSLAFKAFLAGLAGEPKPVVIPGQVLQLAGQGLLVTGPAGCGKSEASLGLLDRGHRLVADDAFTAAYDPSVGWSAGACRQQAGRLAVRGLGVLDTHHLYGPDRQAASTLLALEVRLSPGLELSEAGLLDGEWATPTLPGLPCLALPCHGARGLPLLLETAVRQHALPRHRPRLRNS